MFLFGHSLEKGCVCIPKSSNKNRIEESMTAFVFILEKEDEDFLDSLDEGCRTFHDKISCLGRAENH
jgi:diketogulonate reductase-like aldo/keto reductase